VGSPVIGILLKLSSDPFTVRFDSRAERALETADRPAMVVVREALDELAGGSPGSDVQNEVTAKPMAEFMATIPLKRTDFWWHRTMAVIRNRLNPELRAARQAVWQEAGTQARFSAPHPWFNSHDCRSVAAADYWTAGMGFCGRRRVSALIDLARSCGWMWLSRHLAIVTERPSTLGFDAVGRLHNDTGPAIEYPDGFSFWFIHGVKVPKKVVEAPETLTAGEIDAEQNAEVARVMIERFGTGRYLEESRAKLVHEDECGRLYLKHYQGGGEPLMVVKVENSTPNPGGERQIYWLRVPSVMRTAREAVAWTFGLKPDQYRPGAQS
jgi:hypothetical protein